MDDQRQTLWKLPAVLERGQLGFARRLALEVAQDRGRPPDLDIAAGLAVLPVEPEAIETVLRVLRSASTTVARSELE